MKNFLLAALLTALTLAGPSARAATAILAGGCFWCMEADFEKLEGVSDVVSGFTGGTHPDPSYNGAHTGHYEAVRITYDPEVIDYQGILDHFWVNHDPFDARGQFCDKGHEYLAAIFVAGGRPFTQSRVTRCITRTTTRSHRCATSTTALAVAAIAVSKKSGATGRAANSSGCNSGNSEAISAPDLAFGKGADCSRNHSK
jgi:methionine-S-sulfoxide reductase